MDIESFFYGVISVALLFLVIASLGFIHFGSAGTITGMVVAQSSVDSVDSMAGHHSGGAVADNVQSGSENIPENCRPPAGQDIASWKEHLGHHQETKECLKYFN